MHGVRRGDVGDALADVQWEACVASVPKKDEGGGEGGIWARYDCQTKESLSLRSASPQLPKP